MPAAAMLLYFITVQKCSSRFERPAPRLGLAASNNTRVSSPQDVLWRKPKGPSRGLHGRPALCRLRAALAAIPPVARGRGCRGKGGLRGVSRRAVTRCSCACLASVGLDASQLLQLVLL